MPCDPNFLPNITMFELLDEDDRVAFTRVVAEYRKSLGSVR